MCLFEEITGKSWFKMTVDDTPTALYCAYSANYPQYRTSFEAFSVMMQNKKFAKTLLADFEREIAFNGQLEFTKKMNSEAENKQNAGNEAETDINMAEIAAALVVRHGLSADYVMDKMEIWEIESYFRAGELKRQDELERERLWTFFQMLPMAGKKLTSPDKLIQFEWEKKAKEDKGKAGIENNIELIRKVLGIKKNTEEDGSTVEIGNT